MTSNNAKLLIAFLQDMEDYSRDRQAIPIIYTTSKLGWNHDRTIFCPYTDSRIEFEGQGILAGLGRALKEKGNREAWYEKFKTVRGIPMIDFLTAANLSAMILGQLRLEGFVQIYTAPQGAENLLVVKSAAAFLQDSRIQTVLSIVLTILTILSRACSMFTQVFRLSWKMQTT